jgi:hypothetical protein
MSKLTAFLLFLVHHASAFSFRTNDLVAFLGGTDVVTAQESGHLEAWLTIQYHSLNLRFRNFGWEGDTVFEQPRDFGFPPLEQHLKNAAATVLVCQFGRAEALEQHSPQEFAIAYANFLARITNQTSRILLVVPPPFERATGLLPDLTKQNRLLAEYATAIRGLGHPVIDLSKLSGLTDDGLQITARGHAAIAAEFARQLGANNARQNSPVFEEVRQNVIAKNKLWFDYWRPQNWAFLGGDRTSVPSSRDHRDPKIRWFPGEMEKFLPLISAQEIQIQRLANNH